MTNVNKLRHPIAAFVIAVLAVVALLVGALAAGSNPAANDRTGRALPTSAQTKALSKVALRLATRNGDASPRSIDAVASTREQALPVVFVGEMVNGAGGNCYVIQMVGSFETLSSAPLSAASPKASVLTVIVNASTYEVEDLSVGNVVTDIATLGRVFSLGT
jgi:hypothetical protein